jgi:SAM-dependent methyltransferase
VRWADGWPAANYSLLPLRGAVIAHARGRLKPYSLAVFRQNFEHGRALGDLDVVVEAGREAGIAADDIRAGVEDQQVKDTLRAWTDAAIAEGITGIPTVVLPDGRHFWGDDRLDDAGRRGALTYARAMDPEDYRAEARARWEDAAVGWEQRRAAFQSAAEPVSMWMIDRLGPQPGHTILELAAGVGDTGLLAAELVRPAAARSSSPTAPRPWSRRPAAGGRAWRIANVEAKPMEAEWIDLPTASVDGVLCRWGYMLLADPATALGETRRVLRRGGRVTLAAWTQPDANPWMVAIARTLVELGHAAPPEPGEPGPFAFSEPGTIEGLLEDAGFEDILVETVDFSFRFASTDEHFEHQVAMSTRLKDQIAPLTPAEHTALRDAIDAKLQEHVRADGSLELPARTWVAVAGA